MIYAVGDIHGMRSELEKLISLLPLDRDDTLVFIGDYVDRGPDSAGVVDTLIELQGKYRCIFLMGNHESMFLSFLGWEGSWYFGGDSFLQNGGDLTLQSYDFVEGSNFELPEAHRRFYQELVPYHLEGEYAFVHAGVSRQALALSDVTYALSRERPRDLLWERSTMELPHSLGITLVYGHTPMPDLQVRWNLPYTVGIDTGCVYDGGLTAVRLPDETVFRVDAMNAPEP